MILGDSVLDAYGWSIVWLANGVWVVLFYCQESSSSYQELNIKHTMQFQSFPLSIPLLT